MLNDEIIKENKQKKYQPLLIYKTMTLAVKPKAS
jgi:hypothetical protein